MTRCVVIGAGVVGASVAYRLAEAGGAVTVLERDLPGGGTSATSFSWTNSNNKPPRAYHDLNVAGMRAHAALREEFGDIPWWHGGGSLEWEFDEAERRAQRERVERLRAWGYAAEWITPAQLRELEPDVSLDAVRDAPVAYFPDEGWLDPVVFAHAMLAAAVLHGARVQPGVRVTDLVIDAGRITGVDTAGHGRVSADIVVNCAGRWANEAVRAADLHIPLAPTIGFLVFTPPVPARLGRVVRAPQCHLRPDGAGRLMLHRDETDAGLPLDMRPDPRSPEALDLVRRAALILPGIAGARPEAVRIGFRAYPADGYSAVGPIPGVSGYYVAVTHSGVTLAPFLGRAVAEELIGGRDLPQLAPFRPRRFFQAARQE